MMKPILKIVIYLFLLNTFIYISCKKDQVSAVVLSSTPPPPPPPPPQSSTINLNPVPFGNLSKARYHIVAGAAGSKILFVGGLYIVPRCQYDSSDGSWWDCRNESTRVDIYDTITHSWSTHELARYYYGPMPVVTVGNKIFFSGGTDTAGHTWSKKVDIYDASTNSWSTSELSEARTNLAVATVGNKIFFAGGVKSLGVQHVVVSDKVDIYDGSTVTWSLAT